MRGFLVAAALLVAFGCEAGVPGAELPIASIIVGNRQIDVEVAATQQDRTRGLMHRESIPKDHGMLFLFPEERVRAFWMKNTNIPLSLAYADASGTIVRILDLVPLSEEARGSGFPAKYALEMNRGWFAANGVFEGDRIGRIPRVDVN